MPLKIMNKFFMKYLFLFFLSGFVSSQLLIFGVIEREDMLFALMILYGFGMVCLRLAGFADWLAEKKDREKTRRLQ
jgi:hypothetical protein